LLAIQALLTFTIAIMMENKTVDNALLEREYFHLQTDLESFDAKSLTIKAWSISIAGIIAGASAFSQSKETLLFAALVSLMFWLINAAWKTFQYANYQRIQTIEAFMRGEQEALKPLQITSSWGESYQQGGLLRLAKFLFWQHVLLPHGVMFFMLLTAYLYTMLS
jgi:hypothetical protein